jgi:hypothetical protein
MKNIGLIYRQILPKKVLKEKYYLFLILTLLIEIDILPKDIMA